MILMHNNNVLMGAGTQAAAVTSLSHHRNSSWANDKVTLSDVNSRFNPLSVSCSRDLPLCGPANSLFSISSKIEKNEFLNKIEFIVS